MRPLLAKLFALPVNQQLRVAALFVYAFGMTGAYICCRTVADTLFLNRLGFDRLPAMILVSATLIAICAAIYGDLVARISAFTRIVFTTHALFALLTLVLFQSLQSKTSLILLTSLYVLAELRGAIGSIQFATLLNELFDKQSPKSAAGIAGVGSTVAGVVCGAGVAQIAFSMGVMPIVWLAIALDLIACLGAILCRLAYKSEVKGELIHKPTISGKRPQNFSWIVLIRNPLTRFIAMLVCLNTALVILIQYQWKAVASETFASEKELAIYFGEFYAVIYLITGLLQLLVTGRILKKFHVVAALSIFPLSLLLISGSMAVVSTGSIFWVLTMARGCDCLRRSITDPTLSLIYNQFLKAKRRQVIAMIGGWFKPITESITAMSLIFLAPILTVPQISAVIVVIALVWIVLVFNVKGLK